MPTTTSTRLPMREVLTGLARVPRPNVFADVDHVDECGAPVLDEHARPIPCENEMPRSTTVAIFGVPGSAKTDGFIAQVTLAEALRDLERGHLRRIGAAAFEVVSLAPAIGPGLTGAQKRRRHLAKVNGS